MNKKGGSLMVISSKIAERIKVLTLKKNISLKAMLSDCELGINTISKISNGKDIMSKNLVKIADYFDVSVDYLLCRTDNPKINE